MRKIAIIEAPSTLGLTSNGVEALPDALLGAGLADRLDARRAGRVTPPPRTMRRDPTTQVLNAPAIARYAVALADAVETVLDDGQFPLVLGGDCSILLGPLLALRRRGRSGLLFLDGHADFYQPLAEPNGEAASMELGFATGRGPALLSDIEGRGPLVRDEDVVVFGRRDAEDAERYGSQRIEDTPITLIDLTDIRADGADAALAHATARLERADLEGFWTHLDCDVLDDAIMPAVDYRLPGGLAWDELESALAAACRAGSVGLDVAIFNPALAPDGAIAARLTDVLAKGLGPAGPRARCDQTSDR